MSDAVEQLRREASSRFADMADSEILKDIRARVLESWGNYPESWSVDLIDIQRLLDMNSERAGDRRCERE